MQRMPATRDLLMLIALTIALVVIGMPISPWLWQVLGSMLLVAAFLDILRQALER